MIDGTTPFPMTEKEIGDALIRMMHLDPDGICYEEPEPPKGYYWMPYYTTSPSVSERRQQVLRKLGSQWPGR